MAKSRRTKGTLESLEKALGYGKHKKRILKLVQKTIDKLEKEFKVKVGFDWDTDTDIGEKVITRDGGTMLDLIYAFKPKGKGTKKITLIGDELNEGYCVPDAEPGDDLDFPQKVSLKKVINKIHKHLDNRKR